MPGKDYIAQAKQLHQENLEILENSYLYLSAKDYIRFSVSLQTTVIELVKASEHFGGKK